MTTIFKKALVLFALVAVALVGAVAVAPAEAQAATGSFTIQSKNAEFAGKTVTAYQMFTVENPVVENGKVTSATYTLNTVWGGVSSRLSSAPLIRALRCLKRRTAM